MGDRVLCSLNSHRSAHCRVLQVRFWQLTVLWDEMVGRNVNATSGNTQGRVNELRATFSPLVVSSYALAANIVVAEILFNSRLVILYAK